jgi:hypothetical protein
MDWANFGQSESLTASCIIALNRGYQHVEGSGKTRNPVLANHSLDFVVERIDTSSGSTVRCLFCVHEGREDVSVGAGSSRKRKRTDKIKYFSAMFQPHKYRNHHEGQHAASWEEYQKLSKEDKAK